MYVCENKAQPTNRNQIADKQNNFLKNPINVGKDKAPRQGHILLC